MKKSKKIILIIVIILAAAILVFAAGAYNMFKTQIRAMNTIEKLEDRFYSMEYDGDYGFDEYLKRGGGASDAEMAAYISEFLSHGFYKPEIPENSFGCSTVAAKLPESGDLIFGRNFDWQKCTAMVVKTRPADGYASISTANLDFLGFGEDYLPEGAKNKMMALAAVYVPLDGMNEKGLCIADLSIDDGCETHQDTEKPDITTTAAIRLILDKCQSVDEAIDTLSQYDMNSSAGLQHHLAISDASGKSVVVEYIDNEMSVIETKIVTNFYLTPGERYGIGSEQSKDRFEKLSQSLSKSETKTPDEVKSLLESVAKHNYPDDIETTEWSVIFNTKEKTAQYYRSENYDKNYTFSIE